MTGAAPRVLHVIPSLYIGGAEKTLVELLSDPTARDGATVAVMVAGGPLERRLAKLGVPIVNLRAGGVFSQFLAVIRLARLIRNIRPDVVQSWLYYADLLSVFALKLSGIRRRTALCWGVRCSEHRMTEYPMRLRAAIWLCTRLSGSPDLVIFNSRAGEISHKDRGYKPRRVEIVENGIACDRFEAKDGKRFRNEIGCRDDQIVIVMIGRNDAQKGFDTFVKIAAAFPSVRAIAVGKGTELLVGPDNLCCLGVRDDIPDILAATDIVLSCSHYGEGFLNVVAEGMAAGKPVICTRVGDATRIVGEAGIVVPPGDLKAMADSLELLISDPARRKALGDAGSVRVRSEFSIHRMVSAFARLYENISATRQV